MGFHRLDVVLGLALHREFAFDIRGAKLTDDYSNGERSHEQLARDQTSPKNGDTQATGDFCVVKTNLLRLGLIVC